MNYPQQPPRVLPPHYLALAVIAMLGIYAVNTAWLQSPALVTGQWRLVGLVPLVVGLVIAIMGSQSFSRAETNIVPFSPATTLVTKGVFGWSRNPMYLGMILFLTGVALLLNDWAPWVIVVAFTLTLRYGFIAREELQMHATFGADFARYCNQTRRWLGRRSVPQ